MKQIPLQPYPAKFAKDHFGADFLIIYGWELAGLHNNVLLGASDIDKGRKSRTTGFEHVFINAQVSATDPKTMILVELTFLQQEFQFCCEAVTSLTQAIQSFEDALRSHKIVEVNTIYQGAEATYPTVPKYLHNSFLRGAIHLACTAHRTHIHNPSYSWAKHDSKSCSYPTNPNMTTIQAAYTEKQIKALGV